MAITQYFKESPTYIHISMAVFIVCFILSDYLNKPVLLYLGFYIALYGALYQLATQLNNTQAEKADMKHLGYIPIFILLLVSIVTLSPPSMLITGINLAVVSIIIYQLVRMLSARTKQSKRNIVKTLKRNKTALLILLLTTTALRLFFDSEGLAISNHCFLLLATLAVFDDCKDVINSES
ncbi:hypothetical protein CBQ28_10895 [Pseudoalteromonas sp. GCY]|uniref:hypothetical protein n=1 Tax=Pseudoalteromonas sp. GCY TaxID=2003316 RepID=UPI000BFEBAFD|nr:hypothetical protein [Pseudoalteromonas sp. GCY]PHI37163.1 hypothetical protein CBQ28_10895 [Pseudoalteromonas sp. GCY]QQQ66396.1 hypothetical protein JJQ94_19275 [Pseudoalteromonas sp. GCY]